MRRRALPRDLAYLEADAWRTLGESTRMALLYALRDGPKCVSELVLSVGLPQPRVSQQLSALRQSGLVRAERRGSHVVYSLVDTRITKVLDLLRGVVEERSVSCL
jgi:ArsR family transcriptional regulator, cadmium/lead-responsive transcriptional repressor